MDPIFELDLNTQQPDHLPLTERLIRQLKAAIIDGRLQSGLRLPASRTLAGKLNVSRNTVLSVYELLQIEGYIESHKGAGTYVAKIKQRRSQKLRNSAVSHDQPLLTKVNPYWRLSENQQILPAMNKARFDFRPGAPDLRFFPYPAWRKQLSKSARIQEKARGAHTPIQGHAGLRRALVQQQSRSRAINCSEEEIMITSGAQQAFDLIAKIFVVPGKTKIAVEAPGYPMFRHAMQSQGAIIIEVPVDEEGLQVSELPKDIDMVYCTASHQFPLGMAMSASRRQSLLDFSQKHNCIVIEDDYDSEFRLGKHPIDALKSLDKTGNVIYVGTFSKCMLPDLRLGFMIVPEWMSEYLNNAKLHTDWHNSWLLQDAVAEFISTGYLEKHLRKMRKMYRQRYQLLHSNITEKCHSLLTPLPAYAGVHLTALVEEKLDAHKLAVYLENHDIAIRSIAHFQPGKGVQKGNFNGLIFGYGNIEEESIPDAITALHEGLVKIRK